MNWNLKNIRSGEIIKIKKNNSSLVVNNLGIVKPRDNIYVVCNENFVQNTVIKEMCDTSKNNLEITIRGFYTKKITKENCQVYLLCDTLSNLNFCNLSLGWTITREIWERLKNIQEINPIWSNFLSSKYRNFLSNEPFYVTLQNKAIKKTIKKVDIIGKLPPIVSKLTNLGGWDRYEQFQINPIFIAQPTKLDKIMVALEFVAYDQNLENRDVVGTEHTITPRDSIIDSWIYRKYAGYEDFMSCSPTQILSAIGLKDSIFAKLFNQTTIYLCLQQLEKVFMSIHFNKRGIYNKSEFKKSLASLDVDILFFMQAVLVNHRIKLGEHSKLNAGNEVLKAQVQYAVQVGILDMLNKLLKFELSIKTKIIESKGKTKVSLRTDSQSENNTHTQ